MEKKKVLLSLGLLLVGGVVYNQLKGANPGGSGSGGQNIPPYNPSAPQGGINNPGNIRVNPANNWVGKIAPVANQQFESFDTIANGTAALYKLLVTYRSKYNLTTVATIIQTYAPKKDSNNVEAYIDAVCSFMGVQPTDVLTLDQYPALVSAMSDEEGNTAVTVSDVNKYLGLS